MEKFTVRTLIGSKTVKQLAYQHGIHPNTLVSRLNRGVKIDKALKIPVKSPSKRIYSITVNGITRKVEDWAVLPEVSVGPSTIRKRIRNGWDSRDAVFMGKGEKPLSQTSNQIDQISNKIEAIKNQVPCKHIYVFDKKDILQALGVEENLNWEIVGDTLHLTSKGK